MSNYDEEDFFDNDFDYVDDETPDETEARRNKAIDWRRIELARERLALRRELGDFDFGI